MANEKQDHMALIAIVGIVAIVGLFLMFFSTRTNLVGQGTAGQGFGAIAGGYTTESQKETGDLTGEAISKLNSANVEEPKPIGDIYYEEDGRAAFWIYNNEKQSPEEFTESLTTTEKQTIIEKGICFVTEKEGTHYCYEDFCNQVRTCPEGATQIGLPGAIPFQSFWSCWGDCFGNPDYNGCLFDCVAAI